VVDGEGQRSQGEKTQYILIGCVSFFHILSTPELRVYIDNTGGFPIIPAHGDPSRLWHTLGSFGLPSA